MKKFFTQGNTSATLRISTPQRIAASEGAGDAGLPTGPVEAPARCRDPPGSGLEPQLLTPSTAASRLVPTATRRMPSKGQITYLS